MSTLVIALAAVSVGGPSVAAAATIYVTGNECPASPIAPYTRQYTVEQASKCMYDPASNNLQGTDADAADYLNTPGALAAGWGAGWVGLGKTDNLGGIPGFTWTQDADKDDGTFTIGALLTATYGQFALAVKDGDAPKWGLFLLPAGVVAGDWHILTQQGDLSHLALFARIGDPENRNVPMPEPASLMLLGSGLLVVARRARQGFRKA